MSSLNILLLTYIGLDTKLDNFFWSVTSLTSTLFLIFSIVFSNIKLFISLKKCLKRILSIHLFLHIEMATWTELV